MIKYIKQDGDIREEFQFDTADEMIRYFDYQKYDKKMDEDFYPDEIDIRDCFTTNRKEFEHDDVVICTALKHYDASPNIVDQTFVVENIQIDPSGERFLVMSNGNGYSMDYYLFEKVVNKVSEYSVAIGRDRPNDKQVLTEAFDKVGIEYEDKGDYLILSRECFVDNERIDVNFDEFSNYKFDSLEVMDDGE